MEALYQLSYSPEGADRLPGAGREAVGLETLVRRVGSGGLDLLDDGCPALGVSHAGVELEPVEAPAEALG